MGRRWMGKVWHGRGARTAAVGALVLALTAGLAGCGERGAAELIAQARTSLAKKDTEAARINLKGALQKAPDNAEARFLLGELLFNSADLAGAEAELRRALELQHPQDQVIPLLASALVGLGKGELLVQQFGATTLADPAAQVRLDTTLALAEAGAGNLEGAGVRIDRV